MPRLVPGAATAALYEGPEPETVPRRGWGGLSEARMRRQCRDSALALIAGAEDIVTMV